MQQPLQSSVEYAIKYMCREEGEMKEKNAPLECIWSCIHCKVLENGFSNVSGCYHEPFARSSYISPFQKLSTGFPETPCNVKDVVTGWLKF